MPWTNGQLLPSQSGSSISSFEPASTMLVWSGSTATAGSFCLFCGNGDGLLPTETSVSAIAAEGTTRAVAHPSATRNLRDMGQPSCCELGATIYRISRQKGQHRLQFYLGLGQFRGRVRV